MMDYIVGIDLGTQRVKGMVARKTKSGKLEILATESVDSTGIRYGMTANPSEAAFAVKRVLTILENKEPLRSEGAVIDKVYVGLSGKSIQTLTHSITRILPEGDDEVTQSLIDGMRKECESLSFDIKTGNGELKPGVILDVRAQEFLVDDYTEYNPVGFSCRNLQGKYSVVYALPELPYNLSRAIYNKAGVEIAGMFVSSMATGDAMLTPKEKELGCVFIDFGAATTSVAVYHNYFLRYTAVIPFGGNELSEDLRELNLVAADAENMKVRHGNAMAELETDVHISVAPVSSGGQGLTVSSHLVASVLEARQVEILGFVQKHLDKSGYGNRLGAGVVIGGGAAKLKNIDKLVSRELGMETRLCDTEINVEAVYSDNFDYLSYAQLISVLERAQTSCVRIKEQPQPVKQPKAKTPNFISRLIKKTGISETTGKVLERAEEHLVGMFEEEREETNN